MLLTDMDFRENVNKPSTQGVKCDTVKKFQIGSLILPDQPWKFHENPSSRFSGILLRDNQTAKPAEMKT